MEKKSIQTITNETVEYYQKGEGNRRILLLHGFPDTPTSFFPLMNRLADLGWNAVAPYTLGYSGESALSRETSISELADWNFHFLSALEWDTATVLGHDWGAIQAYSMAIKNPGRVEKYFALSVPPLSVFLKNLLRDPTQFLRSWYILFFQTGFSIPEKIIQNTDFIEYLWKNWSPRLEKNQEALEEVKKLFSDSERVESALSYYRGLIPTPWNFADWKASRDMIFSPIEIEGTILTGKEDGCIAPQMFKNYEEAVAPGTKLYVIPGAGHFLPIECPEEILRIISPVG